jgi:hypothetical protein
MAKQAGEKKAAGKKQQAAPPPYKCQRTLQEGVCLKFWRSPSGDYDIGGDEVPCNECKWFFD